MREFGLQKPCPAIGNCRPTDCGIGFQPGSERIRAMAGQKFTSILIMKQSVFGVRSSPIIEEYRMKKLLSAFVALFALGVSANAADLVPAAAPYTPAEPIPQVAAAAPNSVSWTGFYVGGFGGYGWSDRLRASLPGVGAVSVSTDEVNGGFGGATAGYNWHLPGSQFVFGAEADVAGAGLSGGVSVLGVTGKSTVNAFGSVTGRAGYVLEAALLYVKGGYAWANNKASVSFRDVNLYSESKLHSGWTIGGGVEYRFAPNLSGKVEYMYADYGKRNYASSVYSGGVNLGASMHTVKFGFNYLFD